MNGANSPEGFYDEWGRIFELPSFDLSRKKKGCYSLISKQLTRANFELDLNEFSQRRLFGKLRTSLVIVSAPDRLYTAQLSDVDLRDMFMNMKHVEFIKREDCSMGITSKGGRKLTCRSYEYNLNLCKLKNNMQTLYWKCSKYVKTRCYARIIMLPNGITKLTGYHNHLPNNRRAPIWKYFVEDKFNQTVSCVVCSRVFPIKKNWGTGNMKRHLKLHPLENAHTRYMMRQEVVYRNHAHLQLSKMLREPQPQ